MKLKIGDTVKITQGKDRGKTGKVEKVLPKNGKVVVTGLNVYKKHVKPRGQGKPGSLAEISRPLDLAKISLICPHCHQVVRVSKKRVCKKCQKTV
jgi:large subunit ribosomal protein L24